MPIDYRIIIGLASPRPATSLEDGLQRIERLLSEASDKSAQIVCFPEAYLPGLRGQDFAVLPWDDELEKHALEAVKQAAIVHSVAVIMGLEHVTPAGRQITACVIDAGGRQLGMQTKNQLDPSEDQFYVPGTARQMFEVDGLKFGIAICHEGWRYPETVRWAATRGAKIVFHPQHTGYEKSPADPAAYYESAMAMRARENTIWFASVNYALHHQESATSVIDPSGKRHAFLPQGEEGVLVVDIDLDSATGLLAARYAPDRY